MDASHRQEELQPTNIEALLAVQTVEMRNVTKGIEEIKAKMEQHVTRNEWEQWKLSVDRELQARRLPWPTVGAFITGAVAVALVIMDKVVN